MAKTAEPEETAETSAAAPPKKSMLGKLLVVGLVLVVVVVECVVAYLCVPTPSNAAATSGNAAKLPAERKKGEAESGEGEDNGLVEVDLKEFSITVFQPASNSTLRVDFHLWGSVAKEREADFKRLFEKNLARFREQVVMTVRSAEMTDLTDPSLGLLKRMIMAKTTTILGQPLLKEVIISDYSSLEQ